MIGRLLTIGFLCANVALGQVVVGQSSTVPTAPTTAAASAVSATTPAQTYAFEVVSIRQNKTPRGREMPPFGPTPNGYRMTNMPLILPLLTAYVPQVGNTGSYNHDQVKNYPDWMDRERYDIDARISDEDRAAWQNPTAQKAMLQSMLQAMLVERCKLKVHREVKEATVYSLVLGKGGIKFKETDPAAEHSGGIKLPWGGVMAQLPPSKDAPGGTLILYGASTASLATLLSQMSQLGHPIEDNTGLTGKYDITIRMPEYTPPAPNEPNGVESASDHGSTMVYSVVESLGLKMVSSKGQVETLVIDHMEHPSEN